MADTQRPTTNDNAQRQGTTQKQAVVEKRHKPNRENGEPTTNFETNCNNNQCAMAESYGTDRKRAQQSRQVVLHSTVFKQTVMDRKQTGGCTESSSASSSSSAENEPETTQEV